jgi:MtrB/PioB family decaheme-associated outer membrane protein
VKRRKSLVHLALWTLSFFIAETAAQEESFAPEKIKGKKPALLYRGEVEVGVGYNTEDSFKLGEYTGLVREGPFAIANFRIHGWDAYDSDRARYFKASGLNLGLDYRSLSLAYGNQGSYELFLAYDQIPRFQAGFPSDKARTPYNGVGSGQLTLAENWVGAPTTQGMAALEESLKFVEIKTERQKFGGGLSWHLAKDWELRADFHHERKEGLDTIAGAFGINGGNPSAVILPEPIDYQTNTLNASLDYLGTKAQFQLAYALSLFHNDAAVLTFQNPYSEAGRGTPWVPVTGFPSGFGQFALPPDNQAHRVTFSGGYNLGLTTRLRANFAYGRMTQNDSFLPFSAIPALNAMVTTPLPRNSLQGRIDNFLVDLGIASRPLPKLDLKANYRFEERDNKTPQDIYVRIAGDAQLQPIGVANANARINLPYSFKQHQVLLDIGYRLLPTTKLMLGYDFEQQDRDFQEKDRLQEHTVRTKIQATPFDFVSGWIQYARAFRDGSDYVDNAAFLSSHTPAFLATLPPEERFENHPSLRKFHLAERDRDWVRGVLTFLPHERITFGLDGSYIQDNYKTAVLGLKYSRIASATIDASYSPRPALTMYAFFTYENLRHEQKGHEHNPVRLPSLTDLAQRWSVNTADEVLTSGLGLNWNLIEDKLDLRLDYTFSLADTRIEPAAGAALSAAPLPKVETGLHRLILGLNYRLRNNLSARLSYLFEILETEDFARDDIALDTMPFVLTLGSISPDYVAHIFGVSFAYNF